MSYDDGDTEMLPDMAKETWRFSSLGMLQSMSSDVTVQSTESNVLPNYWIILETSHS